MPLFSVDRRRFLLPHRVLRPVDELLAQLDELLAAVGAHTNDQRWSEAAASLRRALAALRAPNARELELRAAIAREESEWRAAKYAEAADRERAADERWIAALKELSEHERALEIAARAAPRVIRALRKGQAIVREVKRRA